VAFSDYFAGIAFVLLGDKRANFGVSRGKQGVIGRF
jgi:hypothetical protein